MADFYTVSGSNPTRCPFKRSIF